MPRPNPLIQILYSQIESELEEIRDILIDSNAVSCDVESYLPESCSGHSIYRIPTGYIVQVDYNKLAMAIYNAGYRRKENKDDQT